MIVATRNKGAYAGWPIPSTTSTPRKMYRNVHMKNGTQTTPPPQATRQATNRLTERGGSAHFVRELAMSSSAVIGDWSTMNPAIRSDTAGGTRPRGEESFTKGGPGVRYVMKHGGAAA